jgi:hypothetical protein
MALEVEDGTSKADAESYQSVADWKVYAANQGYDYEALAASEDTDIEAALRRGTNAIDARVRGRLNGAYPTSTTQRLLFPVTGLVDIWGRSIASDAVPVQIVDALAEAAWRELQTAGSMAPDVAAGASVIKREKVGPLETEYSVFGSAAGGSFPAIDNILAGLFGARSIYSGVAVRG